MSRIVFVKKIRQKGALYKIVSLLYLVKMCVIFSYS